MSRSRPLRTIWISSMTEDGVRCIELISTAGRSG